MTLRTWIGRSASLACFVVNAVLLLAYHVRADTENDDDSSTFWERILEGPAGLSVRDKVLMAALVTLGFEFLDFMSYHSGCELYVSEQY